MLQADSRQRESHDILELFTLRPKAKRFERCHRTFLDGAFISQQLSVRRSRYLVVVNFHSVAEESIGFVSDGRDDNDMGIDNGSDCVKTCR